MLHSDLQKQTFFVAYYQPRPVEGSVCSHLIDLRGRVLRLKPVVLWGKKNSVASKLLQKRLSWIVAENVKIT